MYLQAGYTLVDSIEQRITQQGQDDQNQPLKAYSPSYLKFKKNPGDYKAGKELGLGSSRFSGVVDYSLTGEMWNDIDLIEQAVSEDEVKYSFGAQNQVNKDKLSSLLKRDGDPLQPSESELDEAVEFIEERIKSHFANVI